MCAELMTRYPGAQPFPDNNLARRLFFGREHESKTLSNQILAHRLVVVFARSGLGKTWLLNAGVAENLRAEGYVPLSVRVNDPAEGPLKSVLEGIAAVCKIQGVEYVPGDDGSLWRFFRTAQFWRSDVLQSPVLILDQFEELFTLHTAEPRNAFIDQLSFLVRGVRPTEPELAIAGAPKAAKDSPPDLDNSLPAVRIVLSLREDFLAELEELSGRIPGVLDERFRLVPMTREAASLALQEPAKVEDTNLATRPFGLDSQAIDAILDFLGRRVVDTTKKSASTVERFQLQLICQRLEAIAAKKQQGGAADSTKIGLADIGGEHSFRTILTDFYNEQISALPWCRRRRVRRLCAEFLISPQGRRLRMEETEIGRLLNLSSDILKSLVDRRLLRSDQTDSGTYCELSHDSLIKPIMTSGRFSRYINVAVYGFMGIASIILSAGVLIVTIVGVSQDISNHIFARDAEADVVSAVVFLTIAWMLLGWSVRKTKESLVILKRLRI
jgi:hypothetical protein